MITTPTWGETLVKGSPDASQLAILDYILYTLAPDENMPQSAGLDILAKDPGIQYYSSWKSLGRGASMIATDTNLKMAFNFTGASEYCFNFDEVMNIFYIF
jgi:hypothetical protein